MSMYQYSFANVDLDLTIPFADGTDQRVVVTGYATGENLITINRKAPIASTTFGAYGDMTVNLQRITAGDLMFTVLMNSPENKALQDWSNYFQDQAYSDGKLIYPIQGSLVDNMGKDESQMLNGIILAMPAMARGQTVNTVTWVITFEHVTFARENGGDHEALG